MKTHEGRTAIVTGGASGIGRALARSLARRGARVVLADWNEQGARETEERIRGEGGEAECAVVDVSRAEAVKEVVDATVGRHGRLDYLFNNAGVGIAGEVRDFSLEDWRFVLDINLGGAINGVAAAYPLMIEQGFGHIVNTSSLAGVTPFPGSTPYAVSKHALVGFSTSLRAEAAGLGVKVSVVCPGPVESGLLASTRWVNVDKDKALGAFTLKKITAEKCAEAILRGVAKNRPIITITSLARTVSMLYRIAPGLIIHSGERLFGGFRAARLSP